MARLREALDVPVEARPGRYGEFGVRVGGDTVVDGGPLVWLGLVPRAEEGLARVRERLGGA